MRLAIDDAADTTKSSQAAPVSPEEIESQLEDISVIRLLGSGGMGAVYLARQLPLNRLVAIKVLTPHRAEDPISEERFLREARALARLHHPRIVALYDVGRMGQTWFIMMEYVEGASLRELINQGRLSAAEALRLVPQICDAMQYAHDQGVVHRDIKPENILIDQSGQVKIADFGLVKLVGEVTPDNITLTDPGLQMGTIGYMAPEQCSSTCGVDHRADIYALGVIFYELLTGKRPTPDYTPPSRITEVDSRVDRVIACSLKESPDDRFQQAFQMKDAIDRLATRRSWIPLAAIGAVVASLILIAAWNALPKPGTQPQPNRTLDRIMSSAIPLTEPFGDQAAAFQQQAWAKKLNLPDAETNSLQLEFRLIPPGQIELSTGSIARITKPFYMSSTEVTVNAFAEFIEATQYVTQGETSGDGGWVHSKTATNGIVSNPDYTWDHERFAFDPSLPVTMVTIRDIDAFVAWLNLREERTYRLPTYAEWMWASRAGTPTRLTSSDPNALSESGWHSGNSDHQAHPVGKRHCNPWGLYDVFGNVIEYVQDGSPREFALGVFDDPVYAPFAQSRVGCGGSFADPLHSILHSLNMNMPFHSVGFRLVLEIPIPADNAKETTADTPVAK
jgi:serine/threonine protein kinase